MLRSLPSYELMSFPIDPHQISVVGSANVREQPPSTSLTMGWYASLSPSGVSVLTPRPESDREAGGSNISTRPS